LESIKFVEKQYSNIIKISTNNISLLVNINQKVEQINLEYLNDFCEKNFLKPNFVNLFEYENKNDKVFERLIVNSLAKRSDRRRSQKSAKDETEIVVRSQSSKNCVEMRDCSVSPVKKNDCLIF
jgi:DNA-binding Xre family transcriptional regulator